MRLLSLLFCLPALAPAQEPWRVPRLTAPVTVDARSDEPAWLAVAPLPMTVHQPTFGAEPGERTDVRIAHDDDALYVVIDAWESHPGMIRASTMIRDDDAPGDFVNILLDTFRDGQNAVVFTTTPGGNRNDWSLSNDAQSYANVNVAWNAVWDLATRREAGSWHAEFRIPFSSLRFQDVDGRVELGLSINRLTAHSGERVVFPAIEPSAPLAVWKPSRTRHVVLEGVRARRSVRLTPYVLAGREGLRAPDPGLSPWVARNRTEAGGDLKASIGANLTLDLTVNTDFAEAEVDDERVNLTRFPLLYPERRPFFVERAGTFELRTGPSDLLFNSRRMGLTAGGEPVALLGGARLSGRVGRWDIGLLDVQTDRNPAGDRENLGVLRLRRSVLNQRSWAGLLFTTRAGGDSSQAAIGADGELHLGGDAYLTFGGAILAGAAGPGADDGVLPRGAFRVQAERRRSLGAWYRGALASTGARYVPALGYVERLDVLRGEAEAGYGRVISGSGRKLRVSLAGALVRGNVSRNFESSTLGVRAAHEGASGAVWSLDVTRQEDELRAPFVPAPGTTVPAGRHSGYTAQVAFAPSTGPRAVVSAVLRAGDYYDGTVVSLLAGPEWRASAHLRLGGEVQIDRLAFDARGERATSKLLRLRVLASASPALSLSGVVQVNTLSHVATGNVRLRWNLREGHDLWLVYGHQHNLDRDRYAPPVPGTARASLLVKYARTFGT